MTLGYKTVVMANGACEVSYRISANQYNYIIKQPGFKLTPKRLKNQVNAEAEKVQHALNQSIKYFEKDKELGASETIEYQPIDKKKYNKAFKELKAEEHYSVTKHLQPDYQQVEQASKSVYIQIDDICCKEQKPNRNKEATKKKDEKFEQKRKEARANGKKPYKESNYLYQTVTYISKDDNNFSIVSESMGTTLSKTITSLIQARNCQKDNLIFLVDGMRTLHTYIKDKFLGDNYKVILDWYHLAKKVSSELMINVKKSEYRENIESTIKKFLWHGLIEQAKKTISEVDKKQIKKDKSLDTLTNYIDRNRKIIPNYAIRKKLGVKNSTGRVEKENDILVAKRQKRNGMSWSKKGSHSLAIIKCLVVNNQFKSFHESGSYSLKWA